jgi:hypothetical protein
MRERVPTLGVGNCQDEANQWAFDLTQAAFSHKQQLNLRGSKLLSGSETNLQKRRDRSDRMLYRSGPRGQNKTTIANFQTGALTIIGVSWRSYMVRPRDLAVRVSDAQHRDTFRLPIDAARRKAREVIDQNPRDGLTPTVENWRQLPDGQIEFAIRYFLTAD